MEGNYSNISIIVAGYLNDSSTTWDIVNAFRDIGIRKSIFINTYLLQKFTNIDHKIPFIRFRFFNTLSKYLYQIMFIYNFLFINNVDIIFLDKPKLLNKNFVSYLKSKSKMIVVYSRDSLISKSNYSKSMMEAIDSCDEFIYTKTWEKNQIYNLLKNVRITFYPHTSYKNKIEYNLSKKDRLSASDKFLFVGSFEHQRAKILSEVARDENLKLLIIGPNWQKDVRKKYSFNENVLIKNGFINRNKYLALASESIACLSFLRKEVNDQFTDRPVELALNEVCVISEYSEYQSLMFSDNKDCLYFRNSLELISCMKKVSLNKNFSKAIARSARLKALELKLTTQDLVGKILTLYLKQK